MSSELAISAIRKLTFQELDQQKGFVPQLPDVPVSGPTYPEQHYASLYTKPFGDMTDEDLCFITTHQWNPEYFVPLSLAWLQEYPFAGAYYEGQLLLNVGRTPPEFWRDHPVLLKKLCQILRRAVLILETNVNSIDDEGTFIDEDTCKNIFDMNIILSCR